MDTSRLSVVFAAGAFGALLNSLFVWTVGASGVGALIGTAIAPSLTPGWLYPRLVWGGIWGVLFLLPGLRQPNIRTGLLASLGPSAVQLFIVLPMKAGKGVAGLALGPGTPLLVLCANAVWGVAAVWWLRQSNN